MASLLRLSRPFLKTKKRSGAIAKPDCSLADAFISNKTIGKALFLWIKQVRAKSVLLSGPVIKEKANQLAREKGIDFMASNGWFYRFKARRGLTKGS